MAATNFKDGSNYNRLAEAANLNSFLKSYRYNAPPPTNEIIKSFRNAN